MTTEADSLERRLRIDFNNLIQGFVDDIDHELRFNDRYAGGYVEYAEHNSRLRDLRRVIEDQTV